MRFDRVKTISNNCVFKVKELKVKELKQKSSSNAVASWGKIDTANILCLECDDYNCRNQFTRDLGKNRNQFTPTAISLQEILTRTANSLRLPQSVY